MLLKQPLPTEQILLILPPTLLTEQALTAVPALLLPLHVLLPATAQV